MAKKSILVIEDEENIVELIRYNLTQEGYAVTACMKGNEGLKEGLKGKADLILLDLMLPEVDGIEICKTLKQHPKSKRIPVIMLTAKGDESDKVIGLELGADDYMVKPFSPKELMARIKAVLRRTDKAVGSPNGLKAGKLEMDLDKHKVLLHGKSIDLTSKEYGLLQALMEANGRLLSREFLLENVWGYDSAVNIETRTIDMHIGQLRRKIGDESKRLVTVKNAGYRFDFDEEE